MADEPCSQAACALLHPGTAHLWANLQPANVHEPRLKRMHNFSPFSFSRFHEGSQSTREASESSPPIPH